MRLLKRWCRGGLALVLGMPLLFVVVPADAEDGNAQKVIAKAQFMLRQATAEKTALQQQVTDLQKQLDVANKQLADVKNTSGARQQSLQQQLATVTASARERQEKSGGDLQKAQQKLQESQQIGVSLEQKLQAQTDNFSACYANNRRLYDINRELLTKYKDKNAMDALLQKEPFTGVSEVQVENLIQDYQYKLDDFKLPANNGETGMAAPTTNATSSMSGGKAANAP